MHRGAAFGDVDNDGDVDILVTTVNDVPLLLRNDGPSGHGERDGSGLAGGSDGSGLGGERDGSSLGGERDGHGGPAGLLVSAEGVRNNRNGIGARVTVVTDAVRQMREIRSAYS